MGQTFSLQPVSYTHLKSFEKQFRLPQVWAYGLLAAWGIFPQAVQEYKRTRAAFRARGISVFPVSPALLKPLLVKSVRWSEELAIAMESKGFSGEEERTEYLEVRVRLRDWIFLAGCVASVSYTHLVWIRWSMSSCSAWKISVRRGKL